MTEKPSPEVDYVSLVNNLVIPESPTASELKELIARIDQVYSVAQFDYARAKIDYENAKAMYDSLRKQIYLRLMEEGRGKNNDHREAIIQHELENYKLDNGRTVNIVSALNEARERKLFMDSVVRILDQKADRLITASNVLRLEAQLTQ